MRNQPPVRNTCPDINGCIRIIKSVQDNISAAIDKISDAQMLNSSEDGKLNDAFEVAIQLLNEAFSDVDFVDILEDLRDANSALREWGYQMSSECEKLENEIKSM